MSPAAKLEFEVPDVHVITELSDTSKTFCGVLFAVLVAVVVAAVVVVIYQQNATSAALEQQFRSRASELHSYYDQKLQRVDERHDVNVRHLEARVDDLQQLVQASACRCKPAPTAAAK